MLILVLLSSAPWLTETMTPWAMYLPTWMATVSPSASVPVGVEMMRSRSIPSDFRVLSRRSGLCPESVPTELASWIAWKAVISEMSSPKRR